MAKLRKIMSDVRNMPDVSERAKRSSREFDKIESGQYTKIIAMMKEYSNLRQR